MHRISICLFITLTILLLNGCEQQPQLRSLSADAVILAFGDSLTYGTGADRSEAYPAVLAGLLKRTVINAGVPGELSAGGRNRLPQELARHNPELVILCHGGNDFLRRLDGKQTTENLEQMILAARGSGADIVLVGVPKLGFGLEIPPFYKDLAEKYQLPLAEEILVELLGDRTLKSDTIHPNAAGYRQLALAIHRTIEKALD